MAQSISILTPQNVKIDYQLANLGDRILAFIVDGLIKGGYAMVMILIFARLIAGIDSTNFMVIAFILALPLVFYTLLFEVFSDGQTPGKKALQIKVVHLEGSEVRFSSYLLRWLFRIVDISLMSGIIGVLSIALSERGQRIGDIVANTTVISLKSKVKLTDSGYQSIAVDYLPTYTKVTRLKTKDIQTIKEVLKVKGDEAFSLRTSLAHKLSEILEVEKSESSQQFLKQIVKDFNFFQQSEQ